MKENEKLRELVVDTLNELHQEATDLTDDTPLGPAGLDLESLVIAELGMRIEESCGAPFSDEDMERVAGQTLGEFVAEMAERARAGAAAS
ncbi:phosphopantetheine-binding protein [Actinophytocola sp.]|uniref:phosphopantetheine-binding protein n=1 Tax=Actinophytocola sp. TaxID=1872138 RepID=UPI003D6AF412